MTSCKAFRKRGPLSSTARRALTASESLVSDPLLPKPSEITSHISSLTTVVASAPTLVLLRALGVRSTFSAITQIDLSAQNTSLFKFLIQLPPKIGLKILDFHKRVMKPQQLQLKTCAVVMCKRAAKFEGDGGQRKRCQ
jgi:hypothetical protein